VPVWHSGLTKQQTANRENVQKAAFKIILQDEYVNYQLACTTLSTQTLEQISMQNKPLQACLSRLTYLTALTRGNNHV
jgi:hypothetical protein